MKVTIDLPSMLTRATGGQRHVEVEASDVAEAIESLLALHPRLRPHLFDEAGALRPNVLCAIDEEPTRLDGGPRPLRDGAHIVFVPSVAGGATGEQVRFCVSADGTRIAFAVHGDGPPLLLTKTWISHLQYDRADPMLGHLLEELGKVATVVRYDERGYGLSDWDAEDLSLEARIEDLQAVAAAANLERFALMGMGQGGQVAISHAARHGDSVTRLILSGTYAGVAPDYRDQFDEYFETLVQVVRYGWELPDSRFRRVFTESLIPDGTEQQKRWVDDLQPRCTSSDTAIRGARARRALDVTAELSSIAAPTLVLHSRGNRMTPFDQGRLLASSIPEASFVPIDSNNSVLLAQDPAWAIWLDEVVRFLAHDHEPASSPQRAPNEPLTERELELLHLVADGLTNEQIAAQLSLSPRTVERHVSNIYRKLNVSGRAARAAAVAHLLRR